ncbi:hypothetical protein BH10PSE15_BH10PSE15_07960 [soil metagenome]
MVSLLLLLAMSDPAAAALARYKTLTRARPVCTRPSGADILVCGRRAADRYRVPLVVHDPGDPMHEGVRAERERLFARTSNCAEKSIFLVGCGAVGVTGRVNATGTHLAGQRGLAP